MLPVTPHLASECLGEIKKNNNYSWPEISLKYLQKKKYNIVVQINGKKRSIILIEKSIEEADLLKKIKKAKELEKFLSGKDIIKTIFIKDKLINLIVK
jgi:leucyl-tRNA synthetase